jgi:hypothetical protein
MGRARSKLSFANVTSAVALFLALGGGSAIALQGTNTVESNDIIAKNVKTSDLALDAVNSSRIADGGVADADLAEAVRPRPLTFKFSETDNQQRTVVAIGDMTLRATCSQATNPAGRADLRVTIESDGVGGLLDEASVGRNGSTDFTDAIDNDVSASGTQRELAEIVPDAALGRVQVGGLWTYFNNQQTVNLQMHLIADDDFDGAGSGRCFIRGIASPSPPD